MTARRLALILAVWLFGVACGLGYVAVSGGWYEYHMAAPGDNVFTMVNADGWEPISCCPVGTFRRPRLHIP